MEESPVVYCLPVQWLPASAIARPSFPTAGSGSVASNTNKEMLFYHQDYRSSFKSDLRSQSRGGKQSAVGH